MLKIQFISQTLFVGVGGKMRGEKKRISFHYILCLFFFLLETKFSVPTLRNVNRAFSI